MSVYLGSESAYLVMCILHSAFHCTIFQLHTVLELSRPLNVFLLLQFCIRRCSLGQSKFFISHPTIIFSQRQILMVFVFGNVVSLYCACSVQTRNDCNISPGQTFPMTGPVHINMEFSCKLNKQEYFSKSTFRLCKYFW